MIDYEKAPLMAAGLSAALDVLDDGAWHSHEELVSAITGTGLTDKTAASIMRDIRHGKAIQVQTASKFLPGTSPHSYRRKPGSVQSQLGPAHGFAQKNPVGNYGGETVCMCSPP